MCSFARCVSLLLLLATSVVAQTTFNRKVIPVDANSFGRLKAMGDLNKDGVPDLVTLAGAYQSLQLAVLLSNGPASFRSTPQTYAVPRDMLFGTMRVLDVNADGNLDVIGAFTTSVFDPDARMVSSVHVYLGNGDGSLRAPRSQLLAGGEADFAAFNGDRLIDVVTENRSAPHIYLGAGAGGFADVAVVGPEVEATNFTPGDFDGDGKQDLAAVLRTTWEGGSSESFRFLYGDGTGHFSAPSSSTGTFFSGFVAAILDLNKDGQSDILGFYEDVDFHDQTFILYGASNRTISTQTMDEGGFYSRYPAGDFDLDQDLDLELQNYTIFYRNSNGSYSDPIRFYTGGTGEEHYVGDFNRDGKADIFVATIGSGTGFATLLELFVNTTSGSSCTVPTSNGINVCSPTDNSTVQSPVRLRATAKLSGAVYRFEVWANGAKIYTGRDTNTIDAPVDMAPGTYMMTFVARTATGERQEKTIKVTVTSGSTCGRPSSPGIVVCEPTPFADVTSPVHVRAFANTGSTRTYRFELWDGATKLATVRDADEMDASVTLSRGSHRLTFVARRLDGTRYTKAVTVTVR